VLDDGEPQAGSACGGAAAVDAIKPLGQCRHVFGCNADAGVQGMRRFSLRSRRGSGKIAALKAGARLALERISPELLFRRLS